MSRLILFSGGVESTAMLTLADSIQDKLLTVFPTYPAGIPTFNESNLKSIALHYGFTPIFAQIKLPLEPEPYNFVHQLHTFFSISHLWVEKDQSIREVWYGLNNTDLKPNNEPIYKRLMSAWDMLHPDTKFRFPLSYRSKKQQWDLIDTEIKPLVTTCITHNNCGTCSKCLEFTKLVSNV